MYILLRSRPQLASGVRSCGSHELIKGQKFLQDWVLTAFHLGHRSKEDCFSGAEKTHTTPSFFARRMSCVTTMLVRCNCCFSRSIRFPSRCAINGSTIVVGSSYRTASGCAANARAIATDRFIPVERSDGSR